MMPDWLRRALSMIRPLIPKELCGTIEINVFRGGVTTVNVKHTYREDGDPVARG